MENEFKGTPGLWKVGASIWGVNNSNSSLAVWPDLHERNPICLLSPVFEATKQDEANAALIAAAPELLEACIEMLQMITKPDGIEQTLVVKKSFVSKWKRVIKKAIKTK